MDKRKKEHAEAEKMYVAGLSVQEVANFYGVSRQAMWVWLTRRGVKMRPQIRRGPRNHFYRKGSQASKRAIHVLEKAIFKGILIRPVLCQACHQTSVFKNGRSGIEGHHDDYSKPLDVTWLCKKCHFELHAEQKSATKG